MVAAETEQAAEEALELIEVEYEQLPAILDLRQAMEQGAPQIHDEPEYVNFDESDPSRNLAAKIRIDIGDVDKGFEAADLIVERAYEVPKVQQASIEPHVVVTYWDEDDRWSSAPARRFHFTSGDRWRLYLGCPEAYPRGQTPHRGWIWRQARSND